MVSPWMMFASLGDDVVIVTSGIISFAKLDEPK